MLKVTIELIPNGDEARARVLSEVTIANDGAGTFSTGNYAVVMTEYDERFPGHRTAFRTTAAIEGLERDILRPVQLAGEALSLLRPLKRTVSDTSILSFVKILSQEEIDLDA